MPHNIPYMRVYLTQILTYPLQYLPILPYTCLGLGLRMLYLLHLFFLSLFLIGFGE